MNTTLISRRTARLVTLAPLVPAGLIAALWMDMGRYTAIFARTPVTDPLPHWLAVLGAVLCFLGAFTAARRLLADATYPRSSHPSTFIVFAGLVGSPIWMGVHRDLYAGAAALTVASIAFGLFHMYLTATVSLSSLPLDARGMWHPIDERQALSEWVDMRASSALDLVEVWHPEVPCRVWALTRDLDGVPFVGGPLPYIAQIGPSDRLVGFAKFEPSNTAAWTTA